MITFYDIPSRLPLKSWSPNTWKTRFCLNYKSIPYKTEWVQCPDIEPHCKRLGIAPTSIRPDGSGYYSLPAIYDSSTKEFLSDSLKIAQYLDKAYPDTPKIIPAGTMAFQAMFVETFQKNLSPFFWRHIFPSVNRKLLPRDEEYFRRTKEAFFGQTFEEVEPKGAARVEAIQKLAQVFDTVDGWLSTTDVDGPFFLGETISFADLVLATYLLFVKQSFGEESEEWQAMKSWNGGRWEAYLKSMEKYQAVN